MPIEVIMPKLSLTMQEGIITRWIKAEGERVEKDKPLFEVQTEKVNYEIKSPATGILMKILCLEDISTPVGEVIALIGEQGEEGVEIPALETDLVRDKTESGPEPETELETEPEPETKAADKVVIKDDVKAGVTDEEYQVIPLQGMRKIICERMHQSLMQSAQMTHSVEVDVTELAKKRDTIKIDFAVSYNDMLIKITAEVLKNHPMVNSSLKGNEIHVFKKINMGMAVAVPDGLIVPVIQNAGEKTLREIASETVTLAEKTRALKLTKEEMSGGTFTVTNLGMFGIDVFTPIINQPESAILGIGRIVEKPAIFEGEVRKRKMMFLSLTFDHRIIDGAPAAEFLRDMREAVEDPETSLGKIG
jgi:pyruvate dehydrogenase E2 component (dihydrolipoamide acetyltransferase)